MKPKINLVLALMVLCATSTYAQTSKASYSDPEEFKAVTSQVKYPAGVAEQGKEGDVVLSFTVTKNGSLANVNIDQTPDMMFSIATMEAFGALKGDWIPAQENGESVDMDYKMVFRFRISKPFDYVSSAERSASKGKYDKALKMYTKAIEENPYNGNLLVARAAVYQEMGMESEATQDTQSASELQQSLFVVYDVPSDGSASISQ